MSKAPFFSSVELPRVKRNLFDMTHENKLTGNMGFLIPISCIETVPGDKFRIRPEIFARMAPMIAPMFHRVDIFTHTFFVPMRLVWSDFGNYISGNTSGTIQPVKPFFNLKHLCQRGYMEDSTYFGNSTLWDYLGLPTLPTVTSELAYTVTEEKICSLPFRAYQLIWTEFYRDKNLNGDNPWTVNTTSGEEGDVEYQNLLTLRRRCWQKDYFTSSLPWAQRGPEVTVGLGTQAPVRSNRDGAATLYDANTRQPLDYDTYNDRPLRVTASTNPNEPSLMTVYSSDGIHATSVGYDPNGTLYADLSQASAITINALRRANAIQRFFERSAVGGSRLIESNFAHFGVKGKDSTLQRPQYLGGSMQTINISSVLQNSPSDSSSVQAGLLGSMAGNGISSSLNRPITHYCDEQGYIITLMSVMPKASYQQGLPKMFSKFDRLDEYFPEFAHIGEQAVKNKELYFALTNTIYNNRDFGYQSRFSEMKYLADEVHGDFRDSMDFWHMGRKFNGSGSSYESNSEPVLNNDFVECHPTHRIFNVTLENYDKVYFECLLKIKALRPMPIFGTPSF